MSIDGVFIHYLVRELNNSLKQSRVKKFTSINYHKFILSFGSLNLLFEISSSNTRICLTDTCFISTEKMPYFQSMLKKQLEGSLLNQVRQYQNDRIVFFDFVKFDDLGYQKKRTLVVELFGRNTNALLLDDNDTIIDCFKRKLPSIESDIIALPGIKYGIITSDKINPFTVNTLHEANIYQGVGNLLFTEMCYRNDITFINGDYQPTLYTVGQKKLFYCFPLTHLADAQSRTFTSLSLLLENYFSEVTADKTFNQEQQNIINHINKEIAKAVNKQNKQRSELAQAKSNLIYEKLGNILSANLHLIKKNDTSITVYDFYDDQEIEITIDPTASPVANLNTFYNRYKKAKRTIEHLEEQIKIVDGEISYYQCLLNQVSLSKALDFKEIVGEIKATAKPSSKKPNITIYTLANADKVMVGKNNLQNNYLTHKLALKTDYFFHVQGVPGSHTILRTSKLTDENIKIAAMITAYYSKSQSSSNVAVDYTLIKNVKKVKGTLGSFVTYTNQRTTFVTPDINFINENTVR